MARDHLGLFDTPPDRREIWSAVTVVGALSGALLLIFPHRDTQLTEINAFVPVINAIMLVSELIIATLLYSQAAVFRSRALVILASGYVFASLLLIPHALTFPGAFAPSGLLGAGVNTTAWLASFRRLAFPIAVIAYAILKRVDATERLETALPPPKILGAMVTTLVVTCSATLLAITGHGLLPPLFLNHRDAISANLLILNVATIALTIGAIIILLRQKKSVLDVWLVVALAGWLVQSLLNLPLNARFTLGWYLLFGLMLSASLVVMLALVAESNRLYARLAISTSEREREREAQMMSMDSVAAAISHEIGQPVAAANLSAAASLGWLTGPEPNIKMAIQSLRDTIDAGRRTFEVIKSIRATFNKESGTLCEVSLNDLVRETAMLLDRELAAQKVLLQLTLDDGLPPVVGNRVQLQRVLLNLLTNAIESLSATRRRIRRIKIRTAPVGGEQVVVEVSDSGRGIAPESIVQIFEPFSTTKATGRGLGLSLSRTIVENHGGRLWASPHVPHGATFHLQMPRVCITQPN